MQERVYAFIDESGNHGFDFSKKDISSHFIVTAILVTESKRQELEKGIEDIRKMYFQTGEIKSSSVGKDHIRRRKILEKMLQLDFKVFSVIVDKKKINTDSGLMFKRSFYKFVNNLVHKELRAAFPILTVCADEIGNNDYMKSFSKYVISKEEYPKLFMQRDFYFEDSKRNVLIQLADFISGTLSYVFELEKKDTTQPDYLKILNEKILRIENYPKEIKSYVFNDSALAQDYDETIANMCLKRAQMFINKYDHETSEEDIRNQLQILKYLCFRFINNDTRQYISTNELRNYLKNQSGINVNVQYFRTKIIAKLRDNDVIIASSAKGYKIPSKQEELFDFINHGTMIIMPMLSRLKKCRDIVKLETMGELDLFDNSEYKNLKEYFEATEND